jgi:hypothetical protein
MPELLRSIAGRLREFVGNRRHAPRYATRVAVAVAPPFALEGYTRDLSANGLAVVLPAIRVGGRYLAGENATLRLTLKLPEATIQLRAVPARYEKLEGEEAGYLIGLKITELDERDRALYAEHLRGLKERG